MTERVIFQKKPFLLRLGQARPITGALAGRARIKPFCDGSHKGTDISPAPHEAEATGSLFLRLPPHKE